MHRGYHDKNFISRIYTKLDVRVIEKWYLNKEQNQCAFMVYKLRIAC
ncbi:MAG: hypothetical protein GY710_25680 [Desulfobacteraceae bacterium]|nr:hypothetical protein [Desulfobacteraceae bacterium]